MLFHQENGAWRVWGDYLIGVQGFLAVMWPQLLAFLGLLLVWIWVLRRVWS